MDATNRSHRISQHININTLTINNISQHINNYVMACRIAHFTSHYAHFTSHYVMPYHNAPQHQNVLSSGCAFWCWAPTPTLLNTHSRDCTNTHITTLTPTLLHAPTQVPLLYGLLPFHDDIESVRYTIGVHTVGIFSGGLALAGIVKTMWYLFINVCVVYTWLLIHMYTL